MEKLEIFNNIKNNISNLNSNELEEIFKIIHKNNNNNYTKNNNGIFINLNWLNDEILNQVNNYINFCIKSHNEINKYEDICNMLNESINKEEIAIDATNANIKTIINNKQKVSSSMKFYLLKKKFQKQQLQTNIENYLTYDEVLLF
jgi:hypothetical protein